MEEEDEAEDEDLDEEDLSGGQWAFILIDWLIDY
jgi:hypothetical protein